MVRVISSVISDNMIGLSVENPYTGKIHFNREGLPTSLEPGHGIGLPSVQTTVERYNGTMNIDAKNMRFVVSIMMYPGSQPGEQKGETNERTDEA